MSQHNRVALQGSERRAVAGAESIGPPNPDERVEVTVWLRSKAGQALNEHVHSLVRAPGQQQPLSREGFAEQFGASAEDLARVEEFARQHGLAVVETSAARRSVVLSGRVSQLSNAFGVGLELMAHPDGGSFRGRVGPILIPAQLQDVIEGVFGLDDRPQAQPHFRRLDQLEGIQPLAAAQRSQFSPARIASLYNFPTDVNGQGECVAIIELGGGFRNADLQAYFQQLGIPLPKVAAVSVDHGKNHPSGPNSADGEVMLDIEVVGAVAPGARIVVYFAPNTDQGFVDAITTAVHDTTNRPSIISISWGAPEVAWTQAAIQAMDQAFQAAAAMGVTVYCAAGDNGANDFPPGPGAQPGNHVDFPASSPNVAGCGGTHITVSGNTITQEVVWNDPGGGATGGGVSALFPKPTYQASAVQGNTRGVPDVAGDASPLSGYIVRVDGQQAVIGGTSAVAPLWAGLTALLNQELGAPLGFINPRLYALAGSEAFQDITQGNNNGFNAGPGWDACTGLGRPNGSNLLAGLKSGKAAASAG